jgi:D-beta-D-heptose 7-phosphate kinase/D-beta-D-heptose 1-phosphate adenosyltransferase
LAWETAARLATVAAGLAASRTGCADLSRGDLWLALHWLDPTRITRVLDLAQADRLCRLYHRRGERVVLACGAFDGLDASHLHFLQEAAEQGDVLMVVLYSDRTADLQGPGRPVMLEHDRAALVSALICVDHVVLIDVGTLPLWLHLAKPAVLMQEGATTREQIAWGDIVESHGGRVHVPSPCPGPAATIRLARFRNEDDRQTGG